MNSVCKQTPSQIFGIEPVPQCREDHSGIVLWIGRIWMCLFKKVLIPCAAGVTAEGHTFGPNCVKKSEEGTKPSELPIYSKKCSICGETTPSTPPPSVVEETVGNIRKELWVWQDSLRGYRHKIVDVYRKGFSKADSVVDYLREETHAPQRMGAIALSGAAGYILALRRGMIRRIFYGCCGALGMAAICYPTETMDYLESIVLEGRKGFIVAYHFIYGETPKIPEWLEKLAGTANTSKDQGTISDKMKQAQQDLAKEASQVESKAKKS